MSDIGGGLDGRLAEGTHINGTLEFERAVQIDGRFEGNVKSPGKLILGPTAQVDADIAVGELEVQGQLRGKVQAKTRLLIRAGGSVEANIVTGSLAIENGATFRGNCDMPAKAGASDVGAKSKPDLASGSKDAPKSPVGADASAAKPGSPSATKPS